MIIKKGTREKEKRREMMERIKRKERNDESDKERDVKRILDSYRERQRNKHDFLSPSFFSQVTLLMMMMC